MNKCYYFEECHSYNTTYCNVCNQWFCKAHEKDYGKRIDSFLNDLFK